MDRNLSRWSYLMGSSSTSSSVTAPLVNKGQEGTTKIVTPPKQKVQPKMKQTSSTSANVLVATTTVEGRSTKSNTPAPAKPKSAPKAKRKQSSLARTFTSPASRKKTKDGVIDLTDLKEEDLLPGTPLDLIKSQHSLFYLYNPRGFNKRRFLPPGYCVYCRCPENYCADKVFGEICCVGAIEIMHENGTHDDFDVREMQFFFARPIQMQ